MKTRGPPASSGRVAGGPRRAPGAARPARGRYSMMFPLCTIVPGAHQEGERTPAVDAVVAGVVDAGPAALVDDAGAAGAAVADRVGDDAVVEAPEPVVVGQLDGRLAARRPGVGEGVAGHQVAGGREHRGTAAALDEHAPTGVVEEGVARDATVVADEADDRLAGLMGEADRAAGHVEGVALDEQRRSAGVLEGLAAADRLLRRGVEGVVADHHSVGALVDDR